MNEQIDIKTISDLQLAGMIARSNIELQQVAQKKQMFEQELMRREQEEATAKKVADEMIEKTGNEPVKEEPKPKE